MLEAESIPGPSAVGNIGKLKKKSITSSGIERKTFRLEA
jgi:hypothetical protein